MYSMETSELNVYDQCRICLESIDEMINMFEDSVTTDKLRICCGVQIENNPTLPSIICKQCNDILNISYNFRMLCQRSQKYLSAFRTTKDDIDHQLICEDRGDQISVSSSTLLDVYEDKIQSNISDGGDNVDNSMMVQEEYIEEELNESNVKNIIPLSHVNEQEQHAQKFTPRKTKKQKEPITLMCNICGNLYNNRATFSYHMKLHKNDKKYECEICSKRFMQTCELRAHMRGHTGEKPFTCSYCGRKFRDRSGVTRHERTHTNERPFGCTICGAHFSYSSSLTKHERIHTGEKPYKCMICYKHFAESHKLKAHLLTIKHRELASEKSKLLLLT